ncbi:RES family NAD+ phosphorylase [Mucilaginibacter sp. RS28]|uniref:RES family NAD+ phosphorylase n=1 Tax=Mucilaginibacter straminoryzae TaxID=2932774 RepID=A0A9X1X0B5_9SPHI|nr:RES family NAD+ phosphorylase [Mucilaginibacter straminoryzae]MCJ8208703.1 RES family NAD+ phosphorylase [Mucilaginibacter straminoryzae]
MKLYRIAREKYADDLSGRGGLLTTARWHNHLPVLYTSTQSSTCILEKLVHLETGEIHHDLQMIEMTIPDSVTNLFVDPQDLPQNWNTYPGPRALAKIGNAWLTAKSSLLLYVPSVVDPFSQNVLINPLHEEARELKIESITPFRFDERLYKL